MWAHMFCRLIIKRILLTIGNLLIWAPLMGFVGWLAVDAILVAIATIKIFKWLTTTLIYYENKPRTKTFSFTNWLKSWGRPPSSQYTKQGIHPRSYYRHKTKRRSAQVGHKIPYQTTHHLPIIIATMAQTITQERRTSEPRNPTNSFDSDSFEILIDCGATMSITNTRLDFIGPTTKSPTNIKGATSSTKVEEKGIMNWKAEDDKGKVCSIQIPALLNKITLLTLVPSIMGTTHQQPRWNHSDNIQKACYYHIEAVGVHQNSKIRQEI